LVLVSWLRFNCAKAAFNGASKLVVTPLGRWKLSIVLIRLCNPWVGVTVVEITETVSPGDPFELKLVTYTLPLFGSKAGLTGP
jgi:hypothetical protein